MGENIGGDSLYAASQGIRAYSFEPEAQNYALLKRNIALNRFQDQVVAYNFALNERSGLDVLQVSSTDVGNALHAVGETQGPYSIAPAEFRQGVACYSLDDLVYGLGLPSPNYLKIDVDGIELEIVAGASRLLADKRLCSLLIELDESNAGHMSLIPRIQAFGLKLVSKTACSLTKGSAFETVFNHIFSRLPDHLALPVG